MSKRWLLQELGWHGLEASAGLNIGAAAAADAAPGHDPPPGVSVARRASAALDGVRDLLSKEAFLAAVLLRDQEVSELELMPADELPCLTCMQILTGRVLSKVAHDVLLSFSTHSRHNRVRQ